MILTFGLTVLAWVFFRAENLGHAISYLSGIFSASLFEAPSFPGMRDSLTTIILVIGFITIEWFGREGKYAFSKIDIQFNRFIRWSLYIGLVLIIYFFGNFSESIEFIYFQF